MTVAREPASAGSNPKPSESPFGPPRRGLPRILAVAGFVVVLAAIGVAVYFTTRTSDPTAAEESHRHGAAAASDSVMPVAISPAAERRIGVTFAEATFGPLKRNVRTVGQVTYDETRVTAIAPRIDGWVDQLFVDFTGQAVRKGDPLFSVYSPMLVTAQQELLLAKRLVQDVQAGTPDAVQGATDLLESARRRLLYWEMPAGEVRRIEDTEELQKTVTLRSPVDGVVLEKAVLAGQQIMAGQPLYKIADLSTVWLEGEVFEQDLPAVRLGETVTAEFQALPGDLRRGRIAYIYPTLNPETRTARVRVALPNPGLRLKPGMYATFRFESPTSSAVSVPRSAVLSTGKRDLVFVRQPDGRLAPRDVVLGIATDDRVQVLRGLSAGEKVVASATFLVDAESNLGSALSGMAGMPGMDLSPEPSGAVPLPAAKPDSVPMTDMPGMDQPKPKKE